MNNAVPVRIADALKHLSKNCLGSVERKRTILFELFTQLSARDKFHDEIIGSVVFAKRVEFWKIRMIEPSHGESFLKKSLFDRLAARVSLVELFYGNDSAGRLDILGLKDGPESAASDV